MFRAHSACWLLLISTALGVMPTWCTVVVHANAIDDDRDMPWCPAGEGRESKDLSADEDSEVKFDCLVLAGLVEYRHVMGGLWESSVSDSQSLRSSVLRQIDHCRAPPALLF